MIIVLKQIKTTTHSASFVFLSLLLIFPRLIFAQEADEYALKAALLYKIARFVQWPDDAFRNNGNQIILGVLGKDPFGESLDILENKLIKDKKIVIKRFQSIDDLAPSHILFISSSEKKQLDKILNTLQNQKVLTVSDTESFVQNGGIINFIFVDENIRFEINASAAKQANLKISSMLLRLATSVKID